VQTAIVVFTRDLRLHDNPALALACARARRVLPAFVADPALPAPPNRARFLAQSLADLRRGLRERGAGLVIRHGDPYWRAWRAASWRRPYPMPETITMPDVGTDGELPAPAPGVSPGLANVSPGLAAGGEQAGRRRAAAWLDDHLGDYAGDRDDLAADRTCRLSPYLRFGCVSPLELALTALPLPGGEEFVRQLCWRDFFHQVTAAFPDMARADYRAAERDWTEDPDAVAAWRAGQTGIPIVDAGMRQLAAEGFMHNRARMITASFLTRDLGIHWRHGYAHFFGLLADGDVACNAGNWQWVAGTGNSTRPGRVLNPLRQAQRFDPRGEYVRRYLPELAGLDGAAAHTPWTLPPAVRRQFSYPDPIGGGTVHKRT
jgi:deoxyribodipyrimidine photo-lyase